MTQEPSSLVLLSLRGEGTELSLMTQTAVTKRVDGEVFYQEGLYEASIPLPDPCCPPTMVGSGDQRHTSRSSSSPCRRSKLCVVLASSLASVSLAFCMCSSCPRRRVFTWERPMLLDGQNPQLHVWCLPKEAHRAWGSKLWV